MQFLVSALLIFCFSVLGAGRASAQDAKFEEAKRHHISGVEALSRGEQRVAEGHFRRALELFPRASTAYNLALILQETARSKEAYALYERLLSGAWGEPPVSAEKLREHQKQTRADYAVLEIEVSGAKAATVFVDEESVGRYVDGEVLRVELDAGDHRVSAKDGARTSPARHIVLERRSTQKIDLLFPTPSGILVQEGAEATHSKDLDGVLSGEGDDDEDATDAIWWVTGGVAAAALVTVIAVIALSSGGGDSSSEMFFSEPPFPNVQALGH